MGKRGKTYLAKKSQLEPGKAYTLSDAVALLKQVSFARFDETVEAHFNLAANPKKTKQTIKVTVQLPHQLGKVVIKTEPKAPIIHTVIGKVSFEKEALKDNFEAVLNAVKKFKIDSAFLTPTMGPSIRLKLEDD
ncbi:hypothetical protein L6258_02670 [Candidatus Parcubacteria bacterium]|nr:hypothetical protein [Candidatus Parcubacteria bacterium]